jgi:hypothetical protein
VRDRAARPYRRQLHVIVVASRQWAGARRAARERGKSDSIDAYSVARAALRERLSRRCRKPTWTSARSTSGCCRPSRGSRRRPHRGPAAAALASPRPLARARDPGQRARHRQVACEALAPPGARRADRAGAGRARARAPDRRAHDIWEIDEWLCSLPATSERLRSAPETPAWDEDRERSSRLLLLDEGRSPHPIARRAVRCWVGRIGAAGGTRRGARRPLLL